MQYNICTHNVRTAACLSGGHFTIIAHTSYNNIITGKIVHKHTHTRQQYNIFFIHQDVYGERYIITMSQLQPHCAHTHYNITTRQYIRRITILLCISFNILPDSRFQSERFPDYDNILSFHSWFSFPSPLSHIIDVQSYRTPGGVNHIIIISHSEFCRRRFINVEGKSVGLCETLIEIKH